MFAILTPLAPSPPFTYASRPGVRPVGVISTALDGVKTLLAATAGVQLECGVASAADALDYIFLIETESTTLPRFIVNPHNTLDRRRMGPGTWNQSGGIHVSMELAANDDASVEDQGIDVANRVGSIMQQCEAIEGAGNSGAGESYVNMTSWGPEGIERCEPQHEGGSYYWIANVILEIAG